MWFRRRPPPERDLRTRDEAYLDRTDVVGAAALPLTTYSLDHTQNAGGRVPTSGTEIQRGYPQTTPFAPEPDLLTRHLVIGPGAPREVYSTYNRLRTQIIQRLQENGWRTVAITSPTRRSGNTLTAINLAISLARDFNHTVLLVELDLVNPCFRQLLGFEQQQGIADYLLHDVAIQEIVVNPGIDRLAVIPAGSPVSNSAELLSSPKMAQLMEELKRSQKHRIVLFDLPSVLSVDDAVAFSPFADCALLVVQEGETRVRDVRRALDCLRSTRILGVVLNRSRNVNDDSQIIAR